MRKFSFLACAMLLGVGTLVADDSAGLNSRSNSQDLGIKNTNSRLNSQDLGTKSTNLGLNSQTNKDEIMLGVAPKAISQEHEASANSAKPKAISSKANLNLAQSNAISSEANLESGQNATTPVLLAEVDNATLFDEQTPPPGDVSATYRLDAVEINSVGDDISRSGISEGFLNKGMASGPLDNKKAIEMPYQVNTLTREMLDNQGIQTSDEIFKYLPSAQLQWRGGSEQGRPQTRGFQGSVVGNSFWDGFYSVSTTAIPMAMFESVQVQNGLAGSLYGGQEPSGNFFYTRKRPIKNYLAIWGDFASAGNFGIGIDGSDKTEKMGFRGVLYTSTGGRQPQDQSLDRNLASFALDFYALENLTFETNFSYYKHISNGNYNSASITTTNGVASGQIPSFSTIAVGTSERFMRTTTASAKVKYLPFSFLYLEGGYQWQEAVRSREMSANTQAGFTVPSYFVKAQSEFETGIVAHNITAHYNGYSWLNSFSHANMGETQNLGLLYDIDFGGYFELIASAANTWFENGSYNKNGFSYAGSMLIKPIPEALSIYFTYADSLISGSVHTYGSGHQLNGQSVTTNPYRSKQYEFGIKGRINNSFDLSAAVFQIQRPIFYEGVSGNREFAKQGEQRNRGIELMVGGALTEYISTFGGVTFLDAKMQDSLYEAFKGKKIVGEPKIQANMLFDFIVPSAENLAFFTNLHYTHKRWADESNTLSVPSYFTMDLGARYSTKNLLGKETSFRFNINNLLNRKYWAGMFPNSMLDGVPATTNGRTLNIFRGYDRSFMASVMVKF